MNGAYSTPVYAMQGFLTISDREKPFSQVNYHAPAPDIEVSGAGAIGFIRSGAENSNLTFFKKTTIFC